MSSENLPTNTVPVAAEDFKARKDLVEQAISRTTQCLAHDLRRPLSMTKAILASLAAETNPIRIQEMARTSLPEVQRAMTNVSAFLEDLLMISSPPANRDHECSISSLAQMSLDNVLDEIPETNIELTSDFKNKIPLVVNRNQVGRLFYYLFECLLKEVQREGKINIGSRDCGQDIEIRISASPVYFPDQSIPDIFESLGKASKTGGMGLGIALGKRIVDNHNGTLTCSSSPSSSNHSARTEFVLHLPCGAPIPANDREQTNLMHEKPLVHDRRLGVQDRRSGSKMPDELKLESEFSKILGQGPDVTILVVDDEAIYRNAIQEIVNSINTSKLNLIQARSSKEALELVTKITPSLVIQDLDLGSQSDNGFEVVRKMRTLGYKGHVCIHSNRFLNLEGSTLDQLGSVSSFPKPMGRLNLLKLLIEISDSTSQNSTTGSTQRPKIAFLDDTKIFRFAWRRSLSTSAECIDFDSPTAFFEKCAAEPSFEAGLEGIVTDFHFAPGEPWNGETFGLEMRKRGFSKTLVLCSDGTFEANRFKDTFDGIVPKEALSWEDVRSKIFK